MKFLRKVLQSWTFFVALVTNTTNSSILTSNVYGSIDDEIALSRTTRNCKLEKNGDIFLNLESIKVKKMASNFINSYQITCLSLENGEVEEIENGAFNTLPRLTYLNLARNHLNIRNFSYFGGHEKLQTLVLDHNKHPDWQRKYVRYCGRDNRYAATNTWFFPHTFCEVEAFQKQYPSPVRYTGADVWIKLNDIIDIDDLDLTEDKREMLINVLDEYESREIGHSIWNSIVENYAFPELTHLYLRDSHLHEFNYAKRHFPKLTHLFLSDNELSTVAFEKSMKNSPITHLYLERNNLSRLKTEFLGDIEVLVLDGNRFSQLSNYDCTEKLCLRNFQTLVYLSLSNNSIQFLYPDTFEDSEQLLALNLAGNRMTRIDPKVFSDLRNLLYLNMSSNPLTNYPNICSLVKLTTLVLSDVKLSVVPRNAFCGLPNLRKLHLSRNDIERISPEVFDGLKLSYLDLSKNRLTQISSSPAQLSLRYLDLGENRFENFDQIDLRKARNLELLDFRDNQIKIKPNGIESLPGNVTIILGSSTMV